MDKISNVVECKKESNFVSNEMNIDRSLGGNLQETCISRKPIKKVRKKHKSNRLELILLIREGDSKKILNFLKDPLVRNSIQFQIDLMGGNAFGDIEKYYQKLKNRVTEYDY
ncbi:MAG: hypothetical protein KC646_06885 [Candidatus Cloacimonetes bacterium]|nr:hypothetical protein [Candidatus Cloacimonadota bacterium]